MFKKIGITVALLSALMFGVSVMNTFAAEKKCPSDCTCPKEGKCAKDCEEGKTSTCSCKH